MVRFIIIGLLSINIAFANDTIPFQVNPNMPTVPDRECSGFWMLDADGKTFVCISNNKEDK